MMLPHRLSQNPQYPEQTMAEHDRLSNLILEHWSRYQPLMLAELRSQNRLQEELETTAERFTDLMYELVSVRKVEYHQAWELAIQEFLLPEESSSTSPKSPPEISASQTPIKLAWAERMKRPKQTSRPSGS
ncbi:MAG TPA: hypothetical protein VHY84_28040 [Bryobacteraceae bacterium]|jgi:hypothetical protein|nr:hypothetical protein [Bryobacteraceae bacterium]